MATLKIYKVETNLFRHEPSDKSNWFVSSFYCKVDGDYFQVVESGGSKRGEYLFSDVEVYDIGGSAETFATPQLLMQRLKGLGYTGFFREGEATPPPLADLEDVSISAPTDGQVLKYNESTTQWENANESGGGGGSHITLIDRVTTDQTLQSLSGTNVALYTYMIPANTFTVGDVIQVKAISNKTGTAGGYILRMYINDVNDVNGVNVKFIAFVNTSTSNRPPAYLQRNLLVKTSNTRHLTNGVSYADDFSIANPLNFTDSVIDWTVDQYFFVSATGTASDQAQLIYFELTKR